MIQTIVERIYILIFGTGQEGESPPYTHKLTVVGFSILISLVVLVMIIRKIISNAQEINL